MFPLSDIPVIFSDEALLVVNKPAGLSTLPDGYNPSLPHVKSLLEQQVGRLWIVHRLDKETSGVLLLARSTEAHRALNTQFEQHQVLKIYHALVVGNPEWQAKTIDLPLRTNGDRSHRTVIDLEAGKPALTRLKVLERFSHYCLVEAAPETGRTHQIRVHLSSIGLYIVGDKLYADRNREIPREMESQPQYNVSLSKTSTVGMGLHARSLEITHPISRQRLKFEAKYPAWLEDVLQLLRTTRQSE
jgi:tRNA pseudouridine32 synthase / 23S rRNA pseudouridine746 synthase